MERWSEQRTAKADLHIHTIYSDGTANVREVLEHVATHTDLRVIAITDHDAIGGALEAQRLAPEYGIDVIVGEEISTADGHLLALFINSFLPPGRPAAETIAAVHAQGGLCIAAHPFDSAVPSMGLSGLVQHYTKGNWPLDAIEGLNAAVMWPRRESNRLARECASTLRIPIVGGSDSHAVPTIGLGYTRFAGSSADDLYRAIRAGHVSWGGCCWPTYQYIGLVWRWVRQRSLRGAVQLVFSDGAIPLQQ